MVVMDDLARVFVNTRLRAEEIGVELYESGRGAGGIEGMVD